MTDYIPELGHFALALAVAIAGAQAVLGFAGASTRDTRMMDGAAGLAIGQVIAIATTFAALVWSAVVDDFSVQNVAEHSHSLKPLLYKVTGGYYDTKAERGVIWNDPDLALPWPVDPAEVTVSDRDAKMPRLAECDPWF